MHLDIAMSCFIIYSQKWTEMIKIRQNLKFPSQSQSRCRTEEISPGGGCAKVIDVAKKNCASQKLPNLPKKFVFVHLFPRNSIPGARFPRNSIPGALQIMYIVSRPTRLLYTRPSILCVTQKRAFMPLYIVLGQ